VDIIQLADVTAVVLVPGMGDEVQSIKAGLMEIADIFVINKSDRPSERLEQEIKAMLALAPAERDAWRPPILKTVATSGDGLEQLDAALTARFAWLDAHGGLEQHRARQWRQRLRQFARDRLAEKLLDPILNDDRLRALAEHISQHGADPYSAMDALIAEAIADFR
ncbi:MAG: methylmalonyl Co-A mutase-associated GTPase MeaB, partial [Terriglobales bacterium]